MEINVAFDASRSVTEIEKAMQIYKQLSCDRVPDSDELISAERYKAGGPAITQKLPELFTPFWEKGTLSQEFKDAPKVILIQAQR